MIKINSLLPYKSIHKEVAIQTDGLLPKILISNKNSHICNQSIKYHGSIIDGQMNKTSKQSQYFHQRRREAYKSHLDIQNQGLKFRKDKKENSRMSLQSSKIQAKLFKFLKFEENILKSAIIKHLEGRQLSKDEKKKMDQNIKLSFISNNKHQANYLEQQYQFQQVIVQIPIHQEISITVKEIINGIRDTYSKLISKKDNRLVNNPNNKKISQISESFIYQGKHIKIYQPLIKNWKKDQILPNYLQRYVKQCESKLRCGDDLKLRLITFYQDTYNKYESIPFNKQECGQISQILINSNDNIKEQTYLPNKSSINNGESFIKLKFYNDLRKQIKKLGEDAQKIIEDEMNKFSQE